MEKVCHEWKFTTVDLQERSTWRSGVRSAMGPVQLASYLEGGSLMWMMHLHLHVNQTYYDDMISQCSH